MENTTANLGSLVASSKHFARRLFTTGENRLELLVVEMQEARERLLHAILLSLTVAACGFFALLALNVAVVVLFWNRSPLTVLLALAGLYTVCAAGLYCKLTRLLRDWQLLSATLDQLRKDRLCLEKSLA